MEILISFCFLISVQRYDPTYQSTKLHFEDLAKRYGNPIIVLNLIKVIGRSFIVSFLLLIIGKDII